MGMKAPVTTWMTTATGGERIDWRDIKGRVDLARIATALLGTAAKRQGCRLLWPCPFHNDRNPSMEVDPQRGTWKCWPCNLGGDAATLVMKRNGVGFPEAVRLVAELAGIVTPAVARQSGTKPQTPRVPGSVQTTSKPAGPPPERSSGLPPADALALVVEAEARLWTPEEAAAREYLHGRGLDDKTIRGARLGWTPCAVRAPWKPSGVVIPWFDGGRLALVKIRPQDAWRDRFPEDKRPPKYIEAFRDRPRIYPSPDVIKPGRPLVVAEGEFDCLLLAQELRELAAVVTLGGTGQSRSDSGILAELLPAAPWFLALDGDEAGEKAAAGWPARAVRVRPTGSFKDWTEAAQAGVKLRRWWSDRLAGIEAPPLFTWAELAAQRWGPALHEPADDGTDPYDQDERAAIQIETLIDPTAD
jgi:hypothetical protein